jgi:hypothetical protein
MRLLVVLGALVLLTGCASSIERAVGGLGGLPNGLSACLVFGEGQCSVKVPTMSLPIPLPLPLPAQGRPQ